MLTFAESQLRAAVETAADWGTYVAVHAYTPEAVYRAVAAGAQCIEHGHLMGDRAAETMAKSGTWLSTQPFVNEDDVGPLAGPVLDKFREVIVGTSCHWAA